jgi:predicted nucleic acid-binding protein
LKFFADFPNTFKTATRCNSFAVIDELISEEKKIISFQLSQNICHLLKLKHSQSVKKVFLWIYEVMSGTLTMHIISTTGHLLDIAKNATNRQQQKVESVKS